MARGGLMLTYGKVFYNFKAACTLSCREFSLIYSPFEDQWRRKERTRCALYPLRESREANGHGSGGFVVSIFRSLFLSALT